MEPHICSRCGGDLHLDGNQWVCAYCRATYDDDAERRAAYFLQQALEEERIGRLAELRRHLFDAAHAPYPSALEVLDAANAVLGVYPDDTLAKVYAYSHDRDGYRLATLLSTLTLPKSDADEVMRWLLPSLHVRYVGPLQDFAMRHYKDAERTSYLTRLEEEASKLEEGIYEAGLRRDVFLCYSSADMADVVHVLDLLEENGFQCFAAFRNLRHGKGAAENYLQEIHKAMSACACTVFLSSNASRQATCDAIRVELPYLLDALPDKPRIEYILEDYPDHVPMIVKATLKKAFPEQEHCRTEEDLISRLSTLSSPPLPSKRPTPVPPPVAEPISAEAVVETPLESFQIVRGSGDGTCTATKYIGNEKDVVIPREINVIAGECFWGSGIRSVIIHPFVQAIGDFAFRDCYELKMVRIEPTKVVVAYHHLVREHAFYGCSIDTMIVPASAIQNGSLNDCHIETLTITPAGNPAIENKLGDGAVAGGIFKTCAPSSLSIRHIVVEEGVTQIWGRNFWRISNLETVSLPNSIRFISDADCFDLVDQPPLQDLRLPAHLAGICSQGIPVEHVTIFGSGRIGETFFKRIRSLTIEEGVTEIGKDAFKGCADLSHIDLPQSLMAIGAGAFEGCNALEELDLTSHPVSLGDFVAGANTVIRVATKRERIALKRTQYNVVSDEEKAKSGPFTWFRRKS